MYYSTLRVEKYTLRVEKMLNSFYFESLTFPLSEISNTTSVVLDAIVEIVTFLRSFESDNVATALVVPA